MPGHIKKTSGPDPDPSPWLLVSAELKQKLIKKPYDPKKSVWCNNKADGGYLEGLMESKDGAKVTVNVGGEMKVYKEDHVCQVNPPKFDFLMTWLVSPFWVMPVSCGTPRSDTLMS